MDPDLLLVAGLIFGLFSIPSFIADVFSLRFPRFATVGMVLAAGLIWYAFQENPDGYDIFGIPDVIVNVIGRYIL